MYTHNLLTWRESLCNFPYPLLHLAEIQTELANGCGLRGFAWQLCFLFSQPVMCLNSLSRRALLGWSHPSDGQFSALIETQSSPLSHLSTCHSSPWSMLHSVKLPVVFLCSLRVGAQTFLAWSCRSLAIRAQWWSRNTRSLGQQFTFEGELT